MDLGAWVLIHLLPQQFSWEQTEEKEKLDGGNEREIRKGGR